MYNVRQPLNTEAYLWGHKKQDSELQGLLIAPAPLLPLNSQKSPDGLPFGEPDNIPRLDQVAHIVPDGDIDAASFVCHFAGPNLVPVLCLGHSAWREQNNGVGGWMVK